MGKILKFEPKQMQLPLEQPELVADPEPTPMQVALGELKAGYSQKELAEMFDDLDDDEKFNELMTALVRETENE